jgi:Family of unknown function (DUF6069)
MSDSFEDTQRLSGDPDEELSVDAVRLWSGGVGAAIVAALAGLVSTLVARVVFQIGLSAPHEAAAFDGAFTVSLCVVAAAAALAATGLVHLLLLSTPRPLAYFGWIVGLLTAAAAVTPFLAGGTVAVQLATAVIRLVIGLAIGSLVSTAAGGAVRARSRR